MRPAPRLAGIVSALVLTFDTAAGTAASGDALPGSSSSLVASDINDPNHGNLTTRRNMPTRLARFASALAMASPGLPTAYLWRHTHFNRPGIANS